LHLIQQHFAHLRLRGVGFYSLVLQYYSDCLMLLMLVVVLNKAFRALSITLGINWNAVNDMWW